MDDLKKFTTETTEAANNEAPAQTGDVMIDNSLTVTFQIDEEARADKARKNLSSMEFIAALNSLDNTEKAEFLVRCNDNLVVDVMHTKTYDHVTKEIASHLQEISLYINDKEYIYYPVERCKLEDIVELVSLMIEVNAKGLFILDYGTIDIKDVRSFLEAACADVDKFSGGYFHKKSTINRIRFSFYTCVKLMRIYSWLKADDVELPEDIQENLKSNLFDIAADVAKKADKKAKKAVDKYTDKHSPL